jgi:diguanylate cyclase (GGDEF)-like protein
MMRFKATHDTLTGVWNRGAVLETMEREVWRSRREGISLGVLMVDLDHFKSVNDNYGHPAGDAVLREITKRMQTDVRPYDGIGRYGGEEFLILLPGCNREVTKATAERIRKIISASPVETSAGSLKVTMSIGAVATGDWPKNTPSQILQMADSALYRAKEEGRDRTVVAGDAENEDSRRITHELSMQGSTQE